MDGGQRDQRAAQGLCFTCGKPGHMARNCPEKASRPNARVAQLIDWSPEDNGDEPTTSNVDAVYQQLEAMSQEDQEQLMNRYGGKEGNFSEA